MNPYYSYGQGGAPRSVSIETAQRLKEERDAYAHETRRLQEERAVYGAEIERLHAKIDRLKRSHRAKLEAYEEQERRTQLESDKLVEERAAALEKLSELIAELDQARALSSVEGDEPVAEPGELEGRARLAAGLGRVRDSAVRALRAIDADQKNPWRQGIAGIVEQIDEFLAGEGVEVIGQVGEAFDPKTHRAVGIAEAGGEIESGTIVRVEQCGLRLDQGALVRLASVIVAK